MSEIKLVSHSSFTKIAEELIKNFDRLVEKNKDVTTHANTEASLSWIIAGGIKYFDKLDTNFLGKGNDSGIPDINADHFANNIYRLVNAVQYLSTFWKLQAKKTEELQLLLDIRTLIVHSGEQLSNLKSLNLADYKDSQLGRIISKQENTFFSIFDETSDMDYRIDVWADKLDKKKQYHRSEVDFHIRNESYSDISIYLKADDVRNIVMCYIEDFVDIGGETKKENKIIKLPEIKDKTVNKTEHLIDFDKIASLISRDLRGDSLKKME